MKLKMVFSVREVAGQTVAVPVGGSVDLNAMITLNNTGKFLFQLLENETDENTLTDALLAEYDVDEETARNAVQTFVRTLKEHDFLA